MLLIAELCAHSSAPVSHYQLHELGSTLVCDLADCHPWHAGRSCLAVVGMLRRPRRPVAAQPEQPHRSVALPYEMNVHGGNDGHVGLLCPRWWTWTAWTR